MKSRTILTAVLALTIASLACTFNINLPNTKTEPSPIVTEEIKVPFLSGSESVTDLTFNFGAGSLTLQPGATDALVSGTVRYNADEFKPTITTDSNNVNIEQKNPDLGGLPYLTKDVVNEWDLALANKPITLVIEAGAYNGIYELGGLSIHRLEVKDGASKVELAFSEPNQVEMTAFEYTTGASNVKLTGLGNANLSMLEVNSGAGNYTLDFSGKLMRDMTVNIESGVSTVTIIVPEGVAATLINEGSMISVNTSGGWQQQGDTYILQGSGYKITINAQMGAGSLRLETSR